MSKYEKPIDHRAMREKLGLNQSQYWNPLGVKQSSGSRYEAGLQDIPKPVEKLAILAYRNHVVIPEIR